jgi:hypothetical protein
MIDKARDSKPKLPLNWSAAAIQMSSAICDTAFFRYLDWFNYKYNNKRKGSTTTHTTEVSGKSSSQAITLGTLLASDSTGHDSKKLKVSQEKETKNTNLKKKKKAGGKGKSRAA